VVCGGIPCEVSESQKRPAKLVSKFSVVGVQLRCFLIEDERLVRVSRVNLDEGYRSVRSGVVNNQIAVVGVGALLKSATC
jgi:hypothetical protein